MNMRTMPETTGSNRIERAKVGIFLGISLVFVGGLFLCGSFVQRTLIDLSDLSFFPHWSLNQFQSYFSGPLPTDATDINYISKDNAGQLTFKASPSSATGFASRFCFGFLYRGYDPFNAVDDEKAQNGYLIQTERDYFYYSHSQGTSTTYLGNRCYDTNRGGLHQIAINETNPNQYTRRVEVLSVSLTQHLPHKCDGIHISYRNQGELVVGDVPKTVASHYGAADTWDVTVTPGARYEVRVSLVKPTPDTPYGNQLHLTTGAVSVNGNEPYCADCWRDTRGEATSDG